MSSEREVYGSSGQAVGLVLGLLLEMTEMGLGNYKQNEVLSKY